MANTTDTIHSTTQQYLDIHDISNDLVILKDGSCSLILTVDAINFGLLAEEEQDAIMYAYAGLLNSLNYPIQIVIKSQTKDVSAYLRLLDEQIQNTFDENKRQQIMKYRRFVSELIKERNVLDKKFYVIIPASALELGLVSASSVIPGIQSKQAGELDLSQILDKAVTTLHPKRDHLMSLLARIGLFSRQLNTQEIIRLFYVLYNPEAAEGQEITHTRNYTSAVVTAQMDINQPAPLPPSQELPIQTMQTNPFQTQAPIPQALPTMTSNTLPATPTAQFVPMPAAAALPVQTPVNIQQIQPIEAVAPQVVPIPVQTISVDHQPASPPPAMAQMPIPQQVTAAPAQNMQEELVAQSQAQSLINQTVATPQVMTDSQPAPQFEITSPPDLPPPAEI